MKKSIPLRQLILSICIVVFVGTCWAVYRTYPRHIALSVKGIEYQLGSSHTWTKPVTLQMNGTLDRPLFGRRSFHGTMVLTGSTVPDRDNGQWLDIAFNGDEGIIDYLNWKTMAGYTYGMIYANPQFNKFTIAVFEPGPRGGGWSGADGLMISVPAQTRDDGLQLSNELMKERLAGHKPLQ